MSFDNHVDIAKNVQQSSLIWCKNWFSQIWRFTPTSKDQYDYQRGTIDK